MMTCTLWYLFLGAEIFHLTEEERRYRKVGSNWQTGGRPQNHQPPFGNPEEEAVLLLLTSHYALFLLSIEVKWITWLWLEHRCLLMVDAVGELRKLVIFAPCLKDKISMCFHEATYMPKILLTKNISSTTMADWEDIPCKMHILLLPAKQECIYIHFV